MRSMDIQTLKLLLLILWSIHLQATKVGFKILVLLTTEKSKIQEGYRISLHESSCLTLESI